MATGTSLVLIAVGAILAFAVDYEVVSGIDINAIGVVLMIVGGIGLLFSLLFLASFSPFGGERHGSVGHGGTGHGTTGVDHSHDHV